MVNSIIFYVIGSLGVFIQNHAKYIDTYWKGKHLYLIFFLSIPISFCYYTSWNSMMEKFHSSWSVKFIFLGLSYITFPIYTYFLLGENPVSLKNFLSVALSFLIVLIQFTMK